MKYSARITKKVRDVHVYAILKKFGENQNALTKIFTRIFNPKGSHGANAAAAEKLS